MDNMDILLKLICLYCREAFTVDEQNVEGDQVFVLIARTKCLSQTSTKSYRTIARTTDNSRMPRSCVA